MNFADCKPQLRAWERARGETGQAIQRLQKIQNAIDELEKQIAHREASIAATADEANERRVSELLRGGAGPRDDSAQRALEDLQADLDLLKAELAKAETEVDRRDKLELGYQDDLLAQLQLIYRDRFVEALQQLHADALEGMAAILRIRGAKAEAFAWGDHGASARLGEVPGWRIDSGSLCVNPHDVDVQAWLGAAIAAIKAAGELE